MMHLKHFNKELSIFELSLSGCRGIDDEALAEFFIPLKRVYILNLFFNDCQTLTKKSLEGSLTCIRNFGNLKYLNLSFANCINLNGTDANQIFAENIAKISILKNLDTLNLNYSGCLFTRAESKNLAEILSSDQVNFRSLSLSLPNLEKEDQDHVIANNAKISQIEFK